MRIGLVLLVLASGGCRGDASQPATPKDPASTPAASACTAAPREHRAGDRVSTHGMVVFGRSGSFFLEHLPMYTPPHNEQIVMRVSLRTAEGKPLEADFSDQAYSLKPAATFSLDDLLLRKLVSFGGDVHRGNFEASGPVLHPGVSVSVEEIVVSRRVPASDQGAPAYYVVRDAMGTAYATNVIRDGSGDLKIIRLGAFSRPVPTGCAIALTEGEAREVVGAPGSQMLWCLRPPEYVEPCEP